MRRYPTEKFEVCDDHGNKTSIVFLIPTPEACQNFTKYLNKKEKAFYNGLEDVLKLSIHISSDPFRALSSMMGKLKKD